MPSTRTPEREAWRNMHLRCTRTDWPGYRHYGGRGIAVDPRRQDFEAFLADMGRRPPGTSLERVDNDPGYTKTNCRWASRKAQQRNTRRNTFIEHAGQRLTVAEWAERTGLNVKTLRKRIQLGWPVQRILEERPNA